VNRFDAYSRRKEEDALRAGIPGFRTEKVCDTADLVRISDTWSDALFDGPFFRSADEPDSLLPAVSLVFVQSRDGNTGADNPSTLGGGETDKHLIYEGLSRVDVDAVLAGAATARGQEMVFSLWHPELVRLRLSRGHARHPAQVIVTDRAELAIERALIFDVEDLPVFIITRTRTAPALRERVRSRPWIRVIDAGEPVSFTSALAQLKADGINVISAVGGRRTATALLKEGLVSDIYLTTSPIDGGEPDTPFHDGPPLKTSLVLEKAGLGREDGVKFEHFVLLNRAP
jgi:riboflavin biosynthesis pyrimidine reductase